MNDHQIKYKSGILAGLTEVIFTHPIDFYKTQKQYNAYNSNNGNYLIKFRFSNMYTGFIPRVVGIVPMRLVFWCTQDYGEDLFTDTGQYKYALAGGLAGLSQSIIDYPIEQFKIRNMVHRQKFSHVLTNFLETKNHINGFLFTASRNVGFAVIFNHIVKNNSTVDNTICQNFMIASSAGFIASATTQPLDYFKTIIQSTNNTDISTKEIFMDTIKKYKHNKFIFFEGLWSRSSISFLSMGIGYTMYTTAKKMFYNNSLS